MAHAVIEAATRREFLYGASAVLAAAVAAACSGAQDPDSGPEDTRTLDDFFGTTTVPLHPERIVAAESITLGNMLALGVTPIGAAVNRNSLPGYLADQMEGIADVTGEDGFDLEQSLALDPDLIIMIAGLPDNPWNKEDYERAKAAVSAFAYTYGYTYIEQIATNLVEVARVLGREERAQELIAAYEQRTGELRDRVQAAGLADRPVSVVRLSMDGNYSIRIGTSESIAFRALGIAQPDGQQDPDDFSVKLSMENLGVLNEADTVFVYVDDNAADEYDAVTQTPLWQSLAPVQEGRVHRVNSGVWNSIDIIGLMRILDDIEEMFISPAEN